MFFNKHWIYAVWQHSAFFPACAFLLDVSTLVTGDVNVKDMVYILLIPGIEVLYPLTRDVNTGVVVAPKFSDTLTLSQSRGGGNSAHRIGWVVPKKKHVVTYLETANFLKALILLCRPAILSRTWRIPMQTSMEVNDLSWPKVRVILKRLLFIILPNLPGFLEFIRTLKSWLCFQEFKLGSLLWKFIFRKEFL